MPRKPKEDQPLTKDEYLQVLLAHDRAKGEKAQEHAAPWKSYFDPALAQEFSAEAEDKAKRLKEARAEIKRARKA